jgi:hypothetical protein
MERKGDPMKKSLSLVLLALAVGCASQVKDKKITTSVPTEKKSELTKVAEFRGEQVTGVTATETGRVFANFPRWRENIGASVVEVMPDGSTKPYPNAEWNKWNGKPRKNHFTCVQSVVAHGGSLFVIDPSSPKMEGVVGTAMLYEFDLETNAQKNSWAFDAKVARRCPPKNLHHRLGTWRNRGAGFEFRKGPSRPRHPRVDEGRECDPSH